MTKEESKKAREVMEAWENGAEIEYNEGDGWESTGGEPIWSWHVTSYRIAKPKPVELAVGMELMAKDTNTIQLDMRVVRSLYSNECCYIRKGRLAIDNIPYIMAAYHGLVNGKRHELFVEEPF